MTGMESGITLGVALLGAALGILNYWRSVTRDRICLRVAARWYVDRERVCSGIAIEVINLGFFPVTLAEVGFLAPGRVRLPPAFGLDQSSLPQRLEPRAAFTALLPAGAQYNEAVGRVVDAYALTACGLRFTAGRRQVRECLQAARAAEHPPA
ncbi:MAG: hypothetical protein PHE83_05775 [Opitutaceae bacterium]|nr:hypothetical protein [Opitutaceae bacterium]